MEIKFTKKNAKCISEGNIGVIGFIKTYSNSEWVILENDTG